MLRSIKRRIVNNLVRQQADPIATYLKSDRVPWSNGYHEYKEREINRSITEPGLLESFRKRVLPQAYGVGIDERIVEYPWIFTQLANGPTTFLDAGSTFNYKYLIEHPVVAAKTTTIYTYSPERENFNANRVSYVYGDLRDMPFKDNCFDEVVCHSTLEHIGMDNSMYGHGEKDNSSKEKDYTYLDAVNELIRVVKSNGLLLLTFPFGKYENHGFFQQFDQEMLGKLTAVMDVHGGFELTFFRYLPGGWVLSDQADCSDSESYNPHTGVGKGSDGAAHSRGICCIKFVKSKR